MKKILLFTIAIISYFNSFSQTSYCTPFYIYGCTYMGIGSVSIDSVNGTNKLNSVTGCSFNGGYSDFTNSTISQSFQPGGNYVITINSSNNSYNQYFAFLIDLNSDGDFGDAGESYFPANTGLNSIISFQIPSGTSLGKKRIRVMSQYFNNFLDINSICSTGLTYGETEDYLIKVGNSPMTFASSTTNAIPNPSIVVPNDTSKYVLQVQVNMDGSLKPQSLKNLKFTTSGTNRTSSIKNAKLWYSGNNYNLDFGTQKIGSTIVSPKDTFSFTLSQPLLEGTNVFWLTYDIDSKAVPNDTLKATCEEITIETSKYEPTLKNGAAGGLIVDYCTPKFKNGYQININSISIGNIIESSYYGNIDNYYIPDQYNFLYIYQGGNTGYSIINKSQKMYYGIYIDYNKDGLYSGNGEFINLGLQQPDSKMTGTINAPLNAKLGINRVRIICSETSLDLNTYCLNGDNGEVHDYTTYIQTPTDMEVYEALYYFEDDKKVTIPSANNEILKVDIQTTGSSNPIKINKLSFNTGNTDTKNITNAKVWYNGILSDFSSATQIGNVIQSPNGNLNFDIEVQLLDNSSNFFWLSYDVPKGTPINENLEATPINIVDQSGKIKLITPDTKSSYYPQNISGKRVTSGMTYMKDTTIVGCSFKFYDDGGENGNYSLNKYRTTYKAPDTLSRMSITFKSLELGDLSNQEARLSNVNASLSQDVINIYDGEILLQTIYPNDLMYSEGPLKITSSSDSITIEFSPSVGNAAGWEADVNCEFKCDKFPLEFTNMLSAQCVNEPYKDYIEITNGFYPPYKYTIENGSSSSTVIINSNNTKLDTILNYGNYNVTVENSKGCSNYVFGNINYPSQLFNIYNNLTEPTCNKASDGSVNVEIYPIGESANYDYDINWTNKTTGNSDNTNDIKNVKYYDEFKIKVSNLLGCQVSNYTASSYSNEEGGTFDANNDTSYYIVTDEKPILTDTLFELGSIKQSSVYLHPLNQDGGQEEVWARYISPYTTTILPDSIHWIVTPSNASTITPGDTMATSLWNPNFSGKLKIKGEPFKGICRGFISPESEIIIKPYARLTSIDSISIFKNDSAKISLSFAGTKPFTLTYRKPNSKVIDTIKNINTNDFSFFVKNGGTYRLMNLLDSSLTVQKLDTNIIIQIDKVSSAIAVINPLKCHKEKTDVGFIIKGGKAPYQIHLADAQIGKFTIINKKSANDSTGIDTSLIAGNYVYRIVDAAKDTSSVYELNIVDTLKSVTIPFIISQISNVPVNTAKLNIAVSSAVAKTSYLWLSSDTTLIKTKSTSSSATFNIATDKTGIADLSVIAIDANGCKSDTSSSVQLTIYPTVTLASGSNTIFYNESDSLKISFNGSLPATLSIGGFGKNDSIYTLTKTSISIPINKSSTYKLTSAKDKNGINALSVTNEYVLIVDTISAIKLTNTGAPCAGKKGTVSVTVTGGKSPYTYYFYQSTKGTSSVKADTSLIIGNYSLIVKDAAGFETSVPTNFTVANNGNTIAGTTITSPESPKNITTDTLQTVVICKPITNISKYKWIISPSIAGSTIDSNSTSKINWTQNYSGEIKISTYGITNEGCITDTSNVVNIVRVGTIKDLTVDKTEIFYSNDTISASVKFTGSGPYKLYYTIDETNFEIDGITSSSYSFKITTPGRLKVIKALDINSMILEDQIISDIQIALDTISTFTTTSIKKALCSTGNGKIKIEINGGKKPYTVFATNTITNIADSISNLNAIDTIDLKLGKYNFTFKDSTGYMSKLSKVDSITLDNNSIEKLTPTITNNSASIITNGSNAEASLTGSISGISNPSFNWRVDTVDAGTFSSTTSANTKLKWSKKFSGFAKVSLIVSDGSCYSDTALTAIKVKSKVEVVLSNKNSTVDVKTFGRGPFKVYINETIGQSDFITTKDTSLVITSDSVLFIKAIDLSTNDTTIINQQIILKTDSVIATPQDIKIYDGFSPNGDNHNDYFVIDNYDTNIKSTLHITDELGFEKFTSKGFSYLNNWDGKDNDGNKLEDGVYICTFEYGGKNHTNIIEIRR